MPKTAPAPTSSAAEAALKEIRRRRENYPTGEETAAAILQARRAGLSASEIAALIGIQRQALYKRFHAEITSGSGS